LVSIELTHTDEGVQQIYYDQFLQVKNFFTAALPDDWIWQLHTTDDYSKTVSKIYTDLSGVSIYKKEDWPKLISFFKTNIIALDEFWTNAKYSFDLLR
jgi:hypothetical protein